MATNWHTRRLYALEAEYLVHLPPLAYGDAKRKLGQIWRNYAPQRWKATPPKLEYGEGIQRGEERYSFAEGRSLIVLCPAHREVVSLSHETTHALQNTNGNHGPTFIALYFRILVEQQIATLEELTLAATRHGLSPQWIRHFDKRSRSSLKP